MICKMRTLSLWVLVSISSGFGPCTLYQQYSMASVMHASTMPNTITMNTPPVDVTNLQNQLHTLNMQISIA